MKPIFKGILTAAALTAGVLTSPAAVTVQGWWHFGELSDYYGDSSGNNRRWGSAFAHDYTTGGGLSGNFNGIVTPTGVGGPLGSSGYTSTISLRSGANGTCSSTMWGIGYNPPLINWWMEISVKPDRRGFVGGSTWIMGSGDGGNYYSLQCIDDGTGKSVYRAFIGGTGGGYVGDAVPIDTNRWMHLAMVNDNGVTSFYTNGVACGASDSSGAAVASSGSTWIGNPGSWNGFDGLIDEGRMCTFDPGTFSTTNFLLAPPGPQITVPPQSAGVWNGGAAPFTISTVIDPSVTYQWQRDGGNLGGKTASELYLNTVGTGDNNAQFDCVLKNDTGLSKTSSVATLTVVPVNADNVAAYQNAVKAESSLAAYYTADTDTGTTLTDSKGANVGALEGTAEYDGRTNRAFGVRALRLRSTADGDVTIPYNAAFEFASGNGTIEAIVSLDQSPSSGRRTIISEAYAGGLPDYYRIQVTADGSSLVYNNDELTQALTWAVSPPLLGRHAHLAVVFNEGTNVTPYVDGASLGTKTQPSFGSQTGVPVWIGSAGGLTGSDMWSGAIDEVAVYGAALSANTIAIHNSKFIYGTNTTSPTITSLPGAGTTKTLLAGGSASFTVRAAGTAPLSYQWTTNNIAIPGATSATLTLSPTTVEQSSAEYGVTVSNPYGSTNSATFGLTFVAPTNTYAAMVMADNPMAYWRLDETSGTTAFDSAGGHDGAYAGSYTLGAAALPKMSDTAVHFTGGNVEVPYSAALNPSTPFSVEFWCNPDNEPSATYVPLCSQYRSGSARQGWCFYDENDAMSWEIHLGNSSGVSLYAYGGGPEPFGGQFYHVVAVWDGSGSVSVYAENQLVGRNTATAFGGTYTPNPSSPLEIGVRNGGAYAMIGVIDDVAIYNYALSATQISNHWSIKFQPSAITTQPVGVTTNEGSTVTLTGAASGYPNTYQWYKGGIALAAVQNYDGTQHYPQGVTSPTLVISQTTPDDNGSYVLHVLNPLPGGGANTTPVNVLINLDLTPPQVASVTALGTPNAPPNQPGSSPYLVKVLFNKRISPYQGTFDFGGTSAGTPTFFQDVNGAALAADWREVIIQTAGLTPGQTYTLTVSGVKDQTVTGNTIVTTNVTFRAPLLSQGLVVWDYYYLGGSLGVSVADLTNSVQIYPNAPMTNWSSSTFDSTPITGGDLNNVAPFGALGDHYGCSLSGWITPTVAGNYTFFLASDDSSELWLSANNDPQQAQLIAYQPGCCNAFTERYTTNATTGVVTTNTFTSDPVSLAANTSYFIRALQVEGGGGDYVKVAWRIAGATNSAASLTPIPGTYLSSYAPGPANFSAPVYSGGQLTISWNGTASLLESDSLAKPMSQWTPVASSSPYQVTPATGGPRMYYRLMQQ